MMYLRSELIIIKNYDNVFDLFQLPVVRGIRLRDGNSSRGRIEVFMNAGSKIGWGTVCDDHFDTNDAQ